MVVRVQIPLSPSAPGPYQEPALREESGAKNASILYVANTDSNAELEGNNLSPPFDSYHIRLNRGLAHVC